MSQQTAPNKQPKAHFKEWLETLQQESWQLELIISGVLLLGIWEARSLVGALTDFFEVYTIIGPITSISFFFIKGLGVIWTILFLNLLIHVFSRGLWIGAIGLRYISGDINYEKLGYNATFQSFLSKKIGGYDDYIEKLEKFSSIAFAYTFLLIFFAFSFTTFLIYLFSIFGLLDSLHDDTKYSLIGVFMILHLVAGLFVLIDFLTLGSLKKIEDKNVSKIYFVVFRYFSIVTLSFLYRPLLYNFLDDKYARKFFLFSIPYVIILMLLPGFIINPYSTLPFSQTRQHTYDDEAIEHLVIKNQYYDDERRLAENSFFSIIPPIREISLPSKIFTHNYGQVFLRIRQWDNDYFKIRKKISHYSKEGISHTIRGKKRNQIKDPKIEAIEAQRDSFLRILILEKVSVIKKIRAKKLVHPVVGTRFVEEGIQLDTIYWTSQVDSITNSWKEVMKEVERQKAYSLIDAVLELNELTINDTPFNDSLTCKFYIHPNINERGLLCFFPLRSLKDGEHILHLERHTYQARKDTVNTHSHNIPFFILKEFAQ